jgi:hypothetical protein
MFGHFNTKEKAPRENTRRFTIPGRDRTADLQVSNPALYPTELLVQRDFRRSHIILHIKGWVAHPSRAICGKGGRPRTQSPGWYPTSAPGNQAHWPTPRFVALIGRAERRDAKILPIAVVIVVETDARIAGSPGAIRPKSPSGSSSIGSLQNLRAVLV